MPGRLVQFTSSCRMNVVVDTEVLISEVQSRPIIWKPGNEDYKNRDLRNKACEEICSSIIPIYDEADNNLKKIR
jgi:hypothetical protein